MRLCTRFYLLTGCCALLAAGAAWGGAPRSARTPADEVFYHFMPIAWRDSDNDPNRFGDFDGMTASLDYLATLGVTAVWMNPIFPSPAYHGYQHGRADLLNSRFGTEAEFVNFVAEAHARDIKVFVDFVVYGISQDSTWFQSAYANPQSPYDGWLAFNNSANTNYLGSVYSTWNGDSVGFIHWNLDNSDATALVTAWAQKWLDPNDDGDPADGIDGYRLDHVWGQYPTGPNGWGYNIDWWETWNANLETVNPDVFIFAEQADWGSTGADLLSAFDAAFTKPFEFAAREALATESASRLYSSMAATVGAWPASGTFMGIIGDHDVDRLASVIGPDLTKGRAAAAVLLTQPFPPIIYYGDEIGMLGVKGSYGSDANDIPMREPFKWNAVHGAPMSDYWVLNGPAYANHYAQDNDGRSVEEQLGVPGSLLESYRTLIAARKANVALRRGAYHAVTNTSTRVWAFLRHAADEQTVLVAINLAGNPVTPALDLSNVALAGGTTSVVNVVTGQVLGELTDANKGSYAVNLPAYGYAILEIDAAPNPAPPEEIDGLNIPGDFGPHHLVATQDNATGMGDNINELNQLFARAEGDSVRLGITGNLATDGTGLALFIDAQPGGQNPLDTAGFSTPPGGIPQLDGLGFDGGFSPDAVVFVNAYSGTIYVDLYELASAGGGVKRYLGNGVVGSAGGFIDGGDNPNDLRVALHNANTAGVSATDAASAATATSGFEMALPFADLGIASGDQAIKMLAMLLRADGEVGNQLLPGLGGGYDNLGYVPLDLASQPGQQYVTFALSRLPGDYDNDGDVDGADFTALLGCLTGPQPAALGPGCNLFDFSGDLDVDLADFATFQQVFGP